MQITKRTLVIEFLVFAIAVAVGVVACGQEPLEIDGPTEASPGSLVRLVADIGEDESAWWIVIKPFDLDYEIVDDGNRVIFATSCKSTDEIIVMLLAQKIVEGRIVTRQMRHVVKVGGGGDPEPDPDEPDPDEPDEPEPTPGRDWSNVTDWVSSQPITKSDTVTAHAWANGLVAVLPECEGKPLGEVKRIVGGVRRSVFSASDNLGNWNPFLIGFDQQVNKDPPTSTDEYLSLVRAFADAIKNGNQSTTLKSVTVPQPQPFYYPVPSPSGYRFTAPAYCPDCVQPTAPLQRRRVIRR